MKTFRALVAANREDVFGAAVSGDDARIKCLVCDKLLDELEVGMETNAHLRIPKLTEERYIIIRET